MIDVIRTKAVIATLTKVAEDLRPFAGPGLNTEKIAAVPLDAVRKSAVAVAQSDRLLALAGYSGGAEVHKPINQALTGLAEIAAKGHGRTEMVSPDLPFALGSLRDAIGGLTDDVATHATRRTHIPRTQAMIKHLTEVADDLRPFAGPGLNTEKIAAIPLDTVRSAAKTIARTNRLVARAGVSQETEVRRELGRALKTLNGIVAKGHGATEIVSRDIPYPIGSIRDVVGSLRHDVNAQRTWDLVSAVKREASDLS